MSRSMLIIPILLVASTVLSAQSRIYGFTGTSPGEEFFMLAGPLTLDNDGVADFIMGKSGSVLAVSGQKGTILYTIPVSTAGGTTNVGDLPSLAIVGDVDNDGLDEFVVGVPGDATNGPRTGKITLHSGANGSVLETILGAGDLNGDGAGDTLGYTVAGVGDVDLDGIPDFGYTAIGDDNDESGSNLCSAIDDPGYADVRSGADGSLIARFLGTPGCSKYRTIVGLGDLNGDGRADYGLGNPNSSQFTGFFYVVSGINNIAFRLHTGDAPGEFFANNAACVGDLDNDGVLDYAVSSPNSIDPFSGSPLAGRVRAFSGATGTLLHDITGNSAQDFFGWSLCGVGDQNGDGHDDFAVGASADDSSFVNAGQLRIFSGDDGSVLFTKNGDVAGHRLGGFNGLIGIGDVNFDGKRDLGVAYFQTTSGSGNMGEIRVLSTSPLSLVQTRHLISISSGGLAGFFLDAGPTAIGDTYFMLGSVTGFAPGIATPNNVYIPLIPDIYFDMTVNPQLTPIGNAVNYLNPLGQGIAFLNVPAGVLPGFYVGLSLYHAFVTYDFTLGNFQFGSNHVVLTFVP